MLFAFNCRKVQPKIPDPQPPAEVKQDSIFFVYINKLGFRKDSIDLGGGNIKIFSGITIESIYYNSRTDSSFIKSTAYGRNIPNKFLMKDSLIHAIYQSYINSQSNLRVHLVWNTYYQGQYSVFKRVSYQLNVAGNDTVKSKGNKFVKFIWPDDTASGRYVKTYSWPN